VPLGDANENRIRILDWHAVVDHLTLTLRGGRNGDSDPRAGDARVRNTMPVDRIAERQVTAPFAAWARVLEHNPYVPILNIGRYH